ncbi:uncharacterized protein C9orf84-like isoform X2 [Mizuhopecten yessoensis]|uniref:uncharacterized protein C9orf84-like isoform X2 n=1 Tax=Mizuhopecten yessoensis TaxID=6573 RepID=UPI000B45A6E5|nr:uncharacterized protein C9orf84-like isoform X2 [Mizuhopecten yessoensis]
MLIYKGIDYLDNALSQRQKLLQKYLVSVPHHLEHVDMYSHTGKLRDSNFREPWKRATVDRKLLQTEGTRLNAELTCLSELVSNQIKEIESLGRDILDSVEHGVFDLGEFIPSSNPSSQEDFQEALQLDVIDSLKTKEIFLKEDIQHWLSASPSDSFKLEEVFMSDSLPDLSRNLPSLNAMRGRLHPNQASDPLNSKGSGLLALKDRIAHEEVLSQEDHCDIARCEASSLDFDWQKFELTEADGELEECLFPFEKENGRKEAIYNSTKIAIELGTSCPLEVKSPASDTFDRLVKRDIDKKYKTEVEKVDTTPPVKFTQSFLEINEIELGDEDIDMKKALLDSPMVGPRVQQLPNCDLKKSLAQLRSHPLIEDDNRLLTPAQKENIVWKIWQHERYLDDVLSLRLPEFEGKPTFDIDIGPNKAKEMLKLKADEDLGKIELCLCWDAISVAAAKMKGCQVERLKEADCHNKCPTTADSPVEQFKKYTSTALFEDKDAVLEEVSSLVLNGDIIENKQKEEKAKAWKPRPLLRPKELSKAGVDPLSDFLLLRSYVQCGSMERQDSSKSFDKTNTKTQKPRTKTMRTDSPCMSPSDLDIQNIGAVMPKKKQKTWDHRTVPVTIQGDFASVLEIIEDQASYFMAALRGSKGMYLPNNFSDLTPDNARFLVKQNEKCLEDNKEDGTKCDTYKATVALHILCGARDILIHCCFESALSHIKSMQEKYQSVLKNCLDDMRKKLFQLKCNFNQRRIFHPKLVSLYCHINERLQKSTKDQDGTKEKILIVTGQERMSLKCCLRDFVRGGSGVKADLLTDLSGELSKRLESVTCLISHRSELFTEFPWCLFTVVMDYDDSGDDTVLQDLCKAHSLPLISFSVKNKDVPADSSTENHMAPQNKDMCAPLTIIGSRYLTSRPELLQLLETRHNLLILERDYDQIKSIDEMYFADLVIDEKTCVVVQPLQDMAEVWQSELFHSKIITLSLKFTTCYIVFYSNQKSKKHSSCLENINRFQAAVGNPARKQEFLVQTFISDNAGEAAKFVRNVCDTSEGMPSVRKDGSRGKRTWLTEECSEEEKTLLSFPCFNSFSAQLVLQKLSLSELFASSYSELVILFSWIPPKFLKSFLEMVHSERGLNCLGKETSHDFTGMSELVEDSISTLEDEITHTIRRNPPLQRQKHLNTDNTLPPEPIAMNRHIKPSIDIEREYLKEGLRKSSYQYNQCIDSVHQQVLNSTESNLIALPSRNFPGEVLGGPQEPHIGMDTQQVSTQDSEDILSLNGSQPSLKLNEFQRAEIEGRNLVANTNPQENTWSTHNEFQQAEIGGKNLVAYGNPQGNTWNNRKEIHGTTRRSCEEFPKHGVQQFESDQNMTPNGHLTAGLDPICVEDAFEQAVSLEVTRRLKAKGKKLNTNGFFSVDPSGNVLYDEARKKSAYVEDRIYNNQDRNHIQSLNQQCARDGITSSDFLTMNYYSEVEDSRLTETDHSLQGTYCPVSQLDYQMQQPTLAHRKQCVAGSSQGEIHSQLQHDISCGNQPIMYNINGQKFNEDRNLGKQSILVESGRNMEEDQFGRKIHYDERLQENRAAPGQVKKPAYGQRSFAGDLALVTQNILQKATSSELPRKSSSVWPPHRRVSIGLAPPRPREDSTKKNQSKLHQQPQYQQLQPNPDRTARNSQQRNDPQHSHDAGYDGQMSGRSGDYSSEQQTYGTPQCDGQSSLWSSYDSPPMDLDKSSDDGYNHTQSIYHQSNLQSHQRPSKQLFPTQKKLSYKRVPGSKGGQTKLVFKGK